MSEISVWSLTDHEERIAALETRLAETRHLLLSSLVLRVGALEDGLLEQRAVYEAWAALLDKVFISPNEIDSQDPTRDLREAVHKALAK